MAELHHVLGSILRDITQARVTSDLYSRDISRYYEQDALLRRFPIPRAEIEEIELDLKFVISSVDASPARGPGMESSTSSSLVRFSLETAAGFLDNLFQVLSPVSPTTGLVTENQLPEATSRRIRRVSSRIYLQQDILSYLETNQRTLIADDGKLDGLAAVQGITGVIGDLWTFLFEDSLPLIGPLENLRDAALRAVDLPAKVESLRNELESLAEVRSDYRINIDVTGDVLGQASESAISTVIIKTTVRNYMWSQVDVVDGRTWRQLSENE